MILYAWLIIMNYEKTRIIPTVETRIFEDAVDPRFAIAEVTPRELSDMKEFSGAAQLRANTYLSEGFVTPELLDENGTELDSNDYRSRHYLMFERTAIDSLARVIGNLRLVLKTDTHPGPLPVEEYFPDYFTEPAPTGSVEVSRLIARHEDTRLQTMVKWPMFIAGYKYVSETNSGPVYGLLAPPLVRQLRLQGVPLNVLDDARYIEEINATKQPVEIDVPALGELIESTGDYGISAANGSVSYIDLGLTERKDAVA